MDGFYDDSSSYPVDGRRCARHGIVISSPNGMVDGLCWACEAQADADQQDAENEELDALLAMEAAADRFLFETQQVTL